VEISLEELNHNLFLILNKLVGTNCQANSKSEQLNLNSSYQTALFYLADHGESLGENGIYLHGLPYFMAPDAQKHTVAFMWFGDSFKVNKNIVANKKDKQLSQDNLFSTLLGLFDIKTKEYEKDMDILK
jgi:lipid A ethanolaminephosphotransferase